MTKTTIPLKLDALDAARCEAAFGNGHAGGHGTRGQIHSAGGFAKRAVPAELEQAMSAAPGRSQASSHRSAEHEGTLKRSELTLGLCRRPGSPGINSREP